MNKYEVLLRLWEWLDDVFVIPEIQMQENDINLPSWSPWASSIVLVKKKNGMLRFSVDYRSLNSYSDSLATSGQARFFSTLDLASGYHLLRQKIR